MKKTSIVRVNGNMIFKGQKLTIGLDLGDQWSCYCVLDEAGKIILEQKVATTPEAMKKAFAKIPRSLIALETGTHSPWVSRLLTELGYKVIVAHAQKVQLISKSTRKDDRHDARTLARLARIDPELLGPVRHRSAKAQIHLTVIRARAELVRARTALVNAARGLVKSYGQRLPKCGTQQVNRELAAGLHAELREALEPLLQEVESLNEPHPGIRGADGENRQGKLPARRTAQTGEGSRNADRADVCSDAGRSASLPEESRGRLFSGVVPCAQGLGGEPAADEHQQRRRPLLEDHAGAGGALHPGTLWRRQ